MSIQPSQTCKKTFIFNYRIKLYHTLIEELFPERQSHQMNSKSNIIDNSPQAIHYEQNTKQLSSLVRENNLFPTESSTRELFNVFTGQQVTLEQTYDMLSFRKVGEQGFENYVKYNLLKYPTTVKAPLCQHRYY